MQKSDLENNWYKNFNVTFELPRYAAKRLRDLAVAGDKRLREIGILKVQVRELRGSSFEEKRHSLHSRNFGYLDRSKPYHHGSGYQQQRSKSVSQMDQLEQMAYLSSPPQVVLYNYLHPSQQLVKEKHDAKQGLVSGYERGEIRTKIIGISRGVLTEESFPIDANALEPVPEWLVQSSLCISFRKHGRCEVACQTGSQRAIYRPRPGSTRFETVQRQVPGRNELLWNSNGKYKVYGGSEPGIVHSSPDAVSHLTSTDPGSAQCSSESILILESLANSLVTSEERVKEQPAIEHSISWKYEPIPERSRVTPPGKSEVSLQQKIQVPVPEKNGMHFHNSSTIMAQEEEQVPQAKESISGESNVSLGVFGKVTRKYEDATKAPESNVGQFSIESQELEDDIQNGSPGAESTESAESIREREDVPSDDLVEEDPRAQSYWKDTQDSVCEGVGQGATAKETMISNTHSGSVGIDEAHGDDEQNVNEVRSKENGPFDAALSNMGQNVTKYSIQRQCPSSDLGFNGSLPISVNLDSDYLKGIWARGNENKEKGANQRSETTLDEGALVTGAGSSLPGYVLKRKRGRPPKSGASYVQVPIVDRSKKKKGKQRPIPRVVTTTLTERETIDADGDISDDKLFPTASESVADDHASVKGDHTQKEGGSTSASLANALSEEDVPLKIIAKRSLEKGESMKMGTVFTKERLLKLSNSEAAQEEKSSSRHMYTHRPSSPSQNEVDKRVRSRSNRWYQKDSIHRDVEELYNRLYPSVACETDQPLPEDVYYGENYPIIFADDDKVGMKFVDMSTAFKLAMKETLSKKTAEAVYAKDDQRVGESNKGKEFKLDTDVPSQDADILDRMQSRRSVVDTRATKGQSMKRKSMEMAVDAEFTVERPHRRRVEDVDDSQQPSHRMSLRPRKAVAMEEGYSSSDSFDEDFDETEPDTSLIYDSDESSDSEPLINIVRKVGRGSNGSLIMTRIKSEPEAEATSRSIENDVTYDLENNGDQRSVPYYQTSEEEYGIIKHRKTIAGHRSEDCDEKTVGTLAASVAVPMTRGAQEIVKKEEFDTSAGQDQFRESKASQSSPAAFSLKKVGGESVLSTLGGGKHHGSSVPRVENEMLVVDVSNPVENDKAVVVSGGQAMVVTKGVDENDGKRKAIQPKEMTSNEKSMSVKFEGTAVAETYPRRFSVHDEMKSFKAQVEENKEGKENVNSQWTASDCTSALEMKVVCDQVRVSSGLEKKIPEECFSRDLVRPFAPSLASENEIVPQSECLEQAAQEPSGDRCNDDKDTKQWVAGSEDKGSSLVDDQGKAPVEVQDRGPKELGSATQPAVKLDTQRGILKSGSPIQKSIEKVAHAIEIGKEASSQGSQKEQGKISDRSARKEKQISTEEFNVSASIASEPVESEERHSLSNQGSSADFIERASNEADELTKSEAKECRDKQDSKEIDQAVAVPEVEEPLVGKTSLEEISKEGNLEMRNKMTNEMTSCATYPSSLSRGDQDAAQNSDACSLPLQSPLLADEAPKFAILPGTDANRNECAPNVEVTEPNASLAEPTNDGKANEDNHCDSSLDAVKGAVGEEAASVESDCNLGESGDASQLPHSGDVSLESAWRPMTDHRARELVTACKEKDAGKCMPVDRNGASAASLPSARKRQFKDIDAAECLLGLFDQNTTGSPELDEKTGSKEESANAGEVTTSTADKGIAVSEHDAQSGSKRCKETSNTEQNDHKLLSKDKPVDKWSEESDAKGVESESEGSNEVSSSLEQPAKDAAAFSSETAGHERGGGAEISKESCMANENRPSKDVAHVEKVSRACAPVCRNIFESLAWVKSSGNSDENVNESLDVKDGNIFDKIGMSGSGTGSLVEKSTDSFKGVANALPAGDIFRTAKAGLETCCASRDDVQNIERPKKEPVRHEPIDSLGNVAKRTDRTAVHGDCIEVNSAEMRPDSVLSTAPDAADTAANSMALDCRVNVTSARTDSATGVVNSEQKPSVASDDCADVSRAVSRDESTDNEDDASGVLRSGETREGEAGPVQAERPFRGDIKGPSPEADGKATESDESEHLQSKIDKRTSSKLFGRDTGGENSTIVDEETAGLCVPESISHNFDGRAIKSSDVDNRWMSGSAKDVEREKYTKSPEIIEKTLAFQSISEYNESSDEDSQSFIDITSLRIENADKCGARVQNSDGINDAMKKDGSPYEKSRDSRSATDGGTNESDQKVERATAEQKSSEEGWSRELDSGELPVDCDESNGRGESGTRRANLTEEESRQRSDVSKRRRSTTDSDSGDASHIVLTRSMRRQSGSPAKRLRSSKN